MEHETIAWCSGTNSIPCWILGRTTHVKRTDGTYECANCHTVKNLPGMNHNNKIENENLKIPNGIYRERS